MWGEDKDRSHSRCPCVKMPSVFMASQFKKSSIIHNHNENGPLTLFPINYTWVLLILSPHVSTNVTPNLTYNPNLIPTPIPKKWMHEYQSTGITWWIPDLHNRKCQKNIVSLDFNVITSYYRFTVHHHFFHCDLLQKHYKISISIDSDEMKLPVVTHLYKIYKYLTKRNLPSRKNNKIRSHGHSEYTRHNQTTCIKGTYLNLRTYPVHVWEINGNLRGNQQQFSTTISIWWSY